MSEDKDPKFEALLDYLVTGFFRDEQAWKYAEREIIPHALKSLSPEDPYRVWCAGCSSGEETYTIAMLLAEALGPEPFCRRVKIYSTDVDEEALAQARAATYSEKSLQAVPPALRKKYFGSPSGGRHTFRADLRRSVIFGQHDLLQDAPISRLDLLICRNTLMYFNAEAQARILARFHFALNDLGVLSLGRAEMLLTHANLFTPIDLKNRVFVKTAKAPLRDRLLVLAEAGDVDAVNHLGRHDRLREIAFDAGAAAQVVLDNEGKLALVNERARAFFNLNVNDLGRPFQDLELSYRPAELRSLIDQAGFERRVVTLAGVERHLQDGNPQYYDLRVTPLYENGAKYLGASITFEDVTVRQRLQLDLQRSTQELETMNEEVQGRPLASLGFGLPVEQLPIEAFVAERVDSRELTLAATNRRGRAILCHIVLTPLSEAGGGRGGVVLTMEEAGDQTGGERRGK